MVLVAFATTTLTVLWATVVVVVLAPPSPWCVVVVWAVAVVVVVAPAAVVVVEPPAAVVVVVVTVAAVLGAPLTLGRVPTATRMAVPTTNATRTSPARTTDRCDTLRDESVSCPSASIPDKLVVPPDPKQAFALVGQL